jgi:hypothetical protein
MAVKESIDDFRASNYVSGEIARGKSPEILYDHFADSKSQINNRFRTYSNQEIMTTKKFVHEKDRNHTV